MSRLAAALSFVLVTAVSPCLAGESDVTSATVGVQGIAAGSTAGEAILRARMHRAVRNVCGDADTRDLAGMADMADCRMRATLQGEALLAARTRPHQAPVDSKVAYSDTWF